MEIKSKFLVVGEVDIQNFEMLSQLRKYSISKTPVQIIEDT